VNEFLSGAILGILFGKKLDKPSFFQSVKYVFAGKKLSLLQIKKHSNLLCFFPPPSPSFNFLM
jgi:hypothetical protein